MIAKRRTLMKVLQILACLLLASSSCTDPQPEFVVGEGGRHACGDIPVPAERFRQYFLHDCWRFTQDALGASIYILGGHDTKDPQQGIIIILDGQQIKATPEYNPVLPTPERKGDVTMYHATVEHICYTTADEGLGPSHVIAINPFNSEPPAFLSEEFVLGLCPQR